METQDILLDVEMDLIVLQNRSRWDGILTQAELQKCRSFGISLAYDCSQQGWIIYHESEEFDEDACPSADFDHTLFLEKSDVTHTLQNFAKELTKRGNHLDSLSEGFNLVNSVLNRSKFRSHIKIRNQLHCLLMAKVYGFFNPNPIPSPEIPVTYRQWALTDAKVYAKIMGNEKIWRHLPEDYPQPFTEELAKNLIEIANIGDGTTTKAIIYDSTPIGQIRLLVHPAYKEIRAAEVVYMLDEEFWGRGLMSKILTNFVNDTFDKAPFDLLYAWIKPENTGSIKCAERAGFVKDCFFNEAELARMCQREGFSRYLRYRTTH